MSLDKKLAELMSGDSQTPVDVALKLLDPNDAIMHTEINNVPTMNKLKVMIAYCKDPEERAIWQELYDSAVIHMVSYKRKREGAMERMFASLQAWYTQNISVTQDKGGLLGRK